MVPRAMDRRRGGEAETRYVGSAVEERVVLVDESDAEVGTLEKQRAHAEGRLHRALSVFVLNARGEMLLQRRASAKYHSGGLWTNACCSHPRPGEPVDAAARRRLREEMGIDCALEPAFAFTYRAEVGGGLVEHEYDHVFLARYDGDPAPSADEVDGWRWVPIDRAGGRGGGRAGEALPPGSGWSSPGRTGRAPAVVRARGGLTRSAPPLHGIGARGTSCREGNAGRRAAVSDGPARACVPFAHNLKLWPGACGSLRAVRRVRPRSREGCAPAGPRRRSRGAQAVSCSPAQGARRRWAQLYRALRRAQPDPERSGGARPHPQFENPEKAAR